MLHSIRILQLPIQGIGVEAPVNEVTDLNSYWRMKASVVFAAWHDPAARILNIDLLALVIAILLPWSTSGVVIFVALWIIALLPTLEPRALLSSLRQPSCLAPIALFMLALAGT